MVNTSRFRSVPTGTKITLKLTADFSNKIIIGTLVSVSSTAIGIRKCDGVVVGVSPLCIRSAKIG